MVIVDDMTLRIRQGDPNDDGELPFSIDIHFPEGDAARVRSLMAAELQAYPETVDRVAAYIATLRRERRGAGTP